MVVHRENAPASRARVPIRSRGARVLRRRTLQSGINSEMLFSDWMLRLDMKRVQALRMTTNPVSLMAEWVVTEWVRGRVHVAGAKYRGGSGTASCSGGAPDAHAADSLARWLRRQSIEQRVKRMKVHVSGCLLDPPLRLEAANTAPPFLGGGGWGGEAFTFLDASAPLILSKGADARVVVHFCARVVRWNLPMNGVFHHVFRAILLAVGLCFVRTVPNLERFRAGQVSVLS